VEELNDLYSSPNIIRVIKSKTMRWAGHVAPTGERRGAYRVLLGKSRGKTPLGRPRYRWGRLYKATLFRFSVVRSTIRLLKNLNKRLLKYLWLFKISMKCNVAQCCIRTTKGLSSYLQTVYSFLKFKSTKSQIPFKVTGT